MSDRTIVLHIGPHKTGSSAIQVTLTGNQAILEQAGFAYPGVGHRDIGHHDLAGAMLAGPSSALDEMATAINAIHRNLVLSSEKFSIAGEHQIRALFSHIEAGHFRVIFYLRSFLPAMYSIWQERVKHGNPESFLEFAANFLAQPFGTHMLNPLRVLHEYATVFGREAITIYRYDQIMRARGDVVGQFMNDVLGIADYAKPPSGQVHNKRLAIAPAELMRRLNAHGLNGRALIMAEPRLRQLLIDIIQKSAPFVGRFDLSYDMFLFSHLEYELIDRWGDRIFGFEQGQSVLFEERTHTVEFLRHEFWLEEPALNRMFQLAIETKGSAPNAGLHPARLPG